MREHCEAKGGDDIGCFVTSEKSETGKEHERGCSMEAMRSFTGFERNLLGTEQVENGEICSRVLALMGFGEFVEKFKEFKEKYKEFGQKFEEFFGILSKIFEVYQILSRFSRDFQQDFHLISRFLRFHQLLFMKNDAHDDLNDYKQRFDNTQQFFFITQRVFKCQKV